MSRFFDQYTQTKLLSPQNRPNFSAVEEKCRHHGFSPNFAALNLKQIKGRCKLKSRYIREEE